MKIPYNKLVRDRIPEILDAEGKEYSIVRCEEDDILAYAKKKLLEEAMEFVENPSAEEAAAQSRAKELPLDWNIGVPELGIDILVTTDRPNCWLSTAFPYWEGPVVVEGSHQGVGYLELTGY